MTGLGPWAANVSAVTLFTDDLAASAAFYRRVFDTAPDHQDDASAVFRFGTMLINLLDVREAGTLIAPDLPGGRDARSRVQLTITVANVDAVCAELARRRVPLLNGPLDRDWGVRTACFEDPSGHKWELAQPITAT